MEFLLLFVLVVGLIAYKKSGRAIMEKKGFSERKNPRSYKARVKAALIDSGTSPEAYRETYDKLFDMAAEGWVQDFFRRTYNVMCDFDEDEVVIESYFLMVFGDMRMHYNYVRDQETNAFVADYREYYEGNKNYNMVITDRALYFGDDLDRSKGRDPVIVPVRKIMDITLDNDYVEIQVKSLLAGNRVHNILCSAGNQNIFTLLKAVHENYMVEKGDEAPFASKAGYRVLP